MLTGVGGASALCRQLADQALRMRVDFQGQDAHRVLLQIAHGANVCKPWEAGVGVRRRPGCWDHLGISKVTVTGGRTQAPGVFCGVRVAGRDHTERRWGPGAASVAESEENVSMSLFYTCQAPPEAWAPPQPLHLTGCPESLFQGSWQGGPGCPEVCGVPFS